MQQESSKTVLINLIINILCKRCVLNSPQCHADMRRSVNGTTVLQMLSRRQWHHHHHNCCSEGLCTQQQAVMGAGHHCVSVGKGETTKVLQKIIIRTKEDLTAWERENVTRVEGHFRKGEVTVHPINHQWKWSDSTLRKRTQSPSAFSDRRFVVHVKRNQCFNQGNHKLKLAF